MTIRREVGMTRCERSGTQARIAILCSASLLLTACPPPRQPTSQQKPVPVESTPTPTPTPVSPAPPAVPQQRGATTYQVDPAASSVHILVYRAGALARFGHNHVMSVRDLSGRIWTHASLSRSGFDLAFPVNQIVVDDPQARLAEGDDFLSEVSQSNRDGTRRNMLRSDLLDAAHYPQVRLRSVRMTGSAQQPQMVVRITVRNVSHDVAVSAAVKLAGNRITVTGEFDVLQTQFGIKPFTAALGTLAVQDKLHIRFNLVAQQGKGSD
jgi:polyisoprenoid-binding protein YceI